MNKCIDWYKSTLVGKILKNDEFIGKFSKDSRIYPYVDL